MGKRMVFGALAFLLVGVLVFIFSVQYVKATGTIYIRADGSIDPPTVNITTADNMTYIFTGNNYDEVIVERDNIVVDGVGYTLQGTGAFETIGIYLSERNNVTIQNTIIKKFDLSIQLHNSSNNSISGNNITNNADGIWLNASNNNSISGNNITANNNVYGIFLDHSSNNTVSGNTIAAHNWYGIYFHVSSNNTISGNNITNNWHGILIDESSNNTLRNNDAGGNTYNLGVDGMSLTHFIQDIDNSNTVNGKPIYYWVNRRDMTVPFDAGYVALVNCTGITVQNLTLTSNGRGIILASTRNSTITKSSITENNLEGILLHNSSNNSISGNNITENGKGFGFYDSDNNIVSRNNITNNENGIGVYYDSDNNIVSRNNITNNKFSGIGFSESKNNTISRNNITASMWGIDLWDSSGNNVTENNLLNNYYGIYLHNVSRSRFYHNNFIDNTEQAYSKYSVNNWDNGCEGNYWSDYFGTDSNGDGIGDTPYTIDQNNTDRYPLMNRYWNPCDINHDLVIDMKDVGTSARAFYSELGDPDYNCHADITGQVPLEPDGVVDMRDIGTVARHFGETYP